ncbi:MAG TPA: hypothetical protein GX505_04880 [Clostridiales bacterium]|nr:hypothetical protein [Clostridiales bacterium]
MDVKDKIKKEIDRLTGLIKENERITLQMPEYLRSNQIFLLELYKKQLNMLENELIKLEA